jgi:Flp pilus assembly protein TadD
MATTSSFMPTSPNAQAPLSEVRLQRTHQFERELELARELMHNGQADAALEMLQRLHDRAPRRRDVMSEIVECCYTLGDRLAFELAVERLAALAPDDPEVALRLAGAYCGNLRPAQAYMAFRRYLERWSHAARADEVRESVRQLQPLLEERLSKLNLIGVEGLSVLAEHESAQAHNARGDYREAERALRNVLAKMPAFVPALNNLSMLVWFRGDAEQAVNLCQQVLDLEAQNVHALANMVRYLWLSGRVEGAQEAAVKLRSAVEDTPESWMRKIEAFSFVADDEGVIEAVRGLERKGAPKDVVGLEFAYHFAGVAAARLGQEGKARNYWQKALQVAPGCAIAADNLADLDKPVGERNGAWAYRLDEWFPQGLLDDAHDKIAPVLNRGTHDKRRQVAREFLRRHVQMTPLLPHMLSRGDADMREFAAFLVVRADLETTRPLLREFVSSAHGCDDVRLRTARAAMESGQLPCEPLQMWSKGQQKAVLPLQFTVTAEPTRVHSKSVEAKLYQAANALYNDNPVEAETVLRQALDIEPFDADLMYQLGEALNAQDRGTEAELTWHDVQRRFPQHVFTASALARRACGRGDLERAQKLLEPLLAVPALHQLELAAMCQAWIVLWAARKQGDAARAWFEFWAEAQPDDPALPSWQRYFEPRPLAPAPPSGLLSRLKKLLRRS